MAESVETTGRSLVAVQSGTSPFLGGYRPDASVVAQLVAARLDLPQTRARRRASAEEGAGAYGATRAALSTARRAAGASWPA